MSTINQGNDDMAKSQNKTELRMTVLADSCAKAITGFTNAAESAERKKGGFADTAFAAGLRDGHCISPKGKDSALALASEECYEQIKASVVEGFPAAARRLMLTPTKALSEGEKDAKRSWQQRVGANLRDLRKALERRAIAAGEIEPAVKVKETKPLEDKIVDQLVTLAQSAQKAEEPNFDVIGFIQALGNTAETIGIDAGIRFHLKLNGDQD